jgi:hypothetical protein
VHCRFAEVVKYEPSDVNSKFFVEEIKLALERAGIKDMSTYKINSYVDKLYGDKTPPPAHSQFRKLGKKAYGFNHLKLEEVVIFDGMEERRANNLRKAEMVRQQVRYGDSDLGKRIFEEMGD